MGRPHRALAVVGIALVSACECRSDVEVANEVLESAARMQEPVAAPAVDAGGDPCAGSPGTLVAVTQGVATELVARGGVVTWAELERGVYGASAQGGGVRELIAASDARDITGLDVSAAGVFAIAQTRRSPVTTLLLFRDRDGGVTESMAATDVILNDVRADDDGAWALAGRVLASRGPASQLLRFSVADRSARVVLQRERGALFLAMDAERLYWIEYAHVGRGQSGPSAVVTVAKSGGPVTTLWEGTAVLSTLAVGSEHLYWVRRGDLIESTGTLVRMPKAGGPVEVVRKGVRTPWGIVDGDAVIVGTGDDSQLERFGAGDGEVVVDERVFVARPVLAEGVLFWATAPARGAERACIRQRALR